MKTFTCDIIIPVWNQLDYTKRCVESIERQTHVSYRLLIVDNASESETADYLRALAQNKPYVELIRNNENLGFIKATNQGLKISTAGYVCLMNNDTVATAGWLSKMISLAQSNKNIGLVNPKSESPGAFSLENYSKNLAKNKGKFIETNQCMGFCMLIKREVLDKIGYLDEVYGMGGFDDTDFSRRAHLAGYKCVCARDAYVYHDWHTSFKKAGNREALVHKNEKIFTDKWGKFLRIGYPISYRSREDFVVDINTSFGLAREWNWVHAWLNGKRPIELPEHQSLRIFNMSGLKLFFYAGVLFRLIERRLKGKKLFDVVLVSDRKLFGFLTFFKRFFGTKLEYIGKDRLSCHSGISPRFTGRNTGTIRPYNLQ